MNEILAMLSAKTVNLEGSGQGGSREITPQIVAAALCGLNEEVILYAQVKFAGDESGLGALARLQRKQTIKAAERWRMISSESPKTISRLSILALNESLHPRHCKRCNGSGKLNNDGPCVRCEGTGNPKEFGFKLLGSLLSVSEHRAKTYWRDRLREEQGLYLDYEQTISDKMKRELKG